jgi:hypothetical protein
MQLTVKRTLLIMSMQGLVRAALLSRPGKPPVWPTINRDAEKSLQWKNFKEHVLEVHPMEWVLTLRTISGD